MFTQINKLFKDWLASVLFAEDAKFFAISPRTEWIQKIYLKKMWHQTQLWHGPELLSFIGIIRKDLHGIKSCELLSEVNSNNR
jgi:hypothetical protein